MKISAGDPAPTFEVRDIDDQPHSLEALRGEKTLLAFFRDAGCPFCNLRIHDLSRRYPDLEQHGLRVLAFFQSPRDHILRHAGRTPRPFPVIPDPDKRVYATYGLESSYGAMLRAATLRIPRLVRALALGFTPNIKGDLALVPADFLIGPDLSVRSAYYGRDISDHIPMEDIERFAAATGA